MSAATAMADTFAIGVTHRAYHLALRRWREEMGYTQAEAASCIGISIVTYQQFETLAKAPSPATVAKIADATDMTEDELFPAWLRAQFPGMVTRVDTEHTIDLVSLGDPANRPMLVAPDTTQASAERGAKADAVQAAIGACNEREQAILRMRYGFDGEDPKTYAQIGAHLGVTLERIRQIEANALRRLRHPSKSRALRPWLGAD